MMKTFKLPISATLLAYGLFAVVCPASGQTWMQTSAPSNSWQSVACSADGTKIVAAAGDGVYFSTNSGTTWILSGTSKRAVALSASGDKWAAVDGGTYIYTTTNYGLTWTAINAPTQAFYYDFTLQFVASSADGSKLMVGGTVYTSSNSGASWTERNMGADSIASSADGTKLFAVNGSGHLGAFGIYISTNSGVDWFSNSAPVSFIESIASSADGKKLALIAGGGGINISTNMGETWIHATNIPIAFALNIASSADGNRLIASVNQTLYVSIDSGATWTTNNLLDGPNKAKVVATSADGNKFFAAVKGGGIWTSQTNPAPTMNITTTSGNPRLSWLVPSTNFVLQHSYNMISWADVTNQPFLNFTNLQYEVPVLPSTQCDFFRLKTH
jgi:hypothetical protein